MAKQFKQGDKLATSSICDSECIFEAEVIKRTEKTVTVKTRMSGANRDVVKVKPVFSEYASNECSVADRY